MRFTAVVIPLLLLSVECSSVAAQAIHLAPAFRRDIPLSTVILRIERKPSTDLLEPNATFYVDDDHLIVTTGKRVDRILLKDRTLGDVVSELISKYDSAVSVTTAYPMHSASLLEKRDLPRVLENNVVQITARPSDPLARVGFGLVLGFGEETSDSNNGLLSQTGFQLDVAGVHQLKPGNRSKEVQPGDEDWYRRWYRKTQVFTQVRLGLSADQQLIVAKEADAPADPAQSQFQAAIEQADQIVLSGQVDVVFPQQDRMEFSLSLGYALNWTQPELFVFPNIVVRDTARDPATLFGADRVKRVADRLNDPASLSDYSSLALLRFHSADKMAYYVGGGVMYREVLNRGFAFSRNGVGQPDSTSLRPLLNGSQAFFWQAVFGIEVPGVIDVRVDGVGPMERAFDKPILRLVLARSFPVKD